MSKDHDPLMAAVKASHSPDLRAALVDLPEPATDPFSTPRRRLEATLTLYRFTNQGGSLLDWAAMQTKLKDPLSEFNRHELEDCFRRFQLRLETHLKSLLRDMRKQDPQGLAEVSRGASPVAQQAMRRADNDR
jgi:hypothetical protein